MQYQWQCSFGSIRSDKDAEMDVDGRNIRSDLEEVG